MRRPLLLLAMASAPSAAPAADVPGGPGTRATLRVSPDLTPGVFEAQGDSDWYRLSLAAGRDYAIRLSATGAGFRLRDSAGAVIRTDTVGDGDQGGYEYRAPYTGTYFLEASGSPSAFGNDYGVGVASDCRGDTTTQCRIRVGQTQQRVYAFAGEDDCHRATLTASRPYTVTIATERNSPSNFALEIRDAGGQTVAGPTFNEGPIRGYRPPRSGTYFVCVGSDSDTFGYPGLYRLSLRSP